MPNGVFRYVKQARDLDNLTTSVVAEPLPNDIANLSGRGSIVRTGQPTYPSVNYWTHGTVGTNDDPHGANEEKPIPAASAFASRFV